MEAPPNLPQLFNRNRFHLVCSSKLPNRLASLVVLSQAVQPLVCIFCGTPASFATAFLVSCCAEQYISATAFFAQNKSHSRLLPILLCRSGYPFHLPVTVGVQNRLSVLISHRICPLSMSAAVEAQVSQLRHTLSLPMSGYKKDDKLILDIGPDAIPLLVSISKVQHTAQGPTILDVDTRTSRGAKLVPANFKLKVFDRRYAYELRDRLRTGSWTNDRDHLMLRDAVDGSLDAYLTEWSRDARLPDDPRSVEMSKREAILWELMRRQYHSDLAMHQALQARNTQSNPRLISTGLIQTGTTMDYVLTLLYNHNQYFNVSCLLLEENEGAAPFSNFPTLPTNQDYHLGLSVFNNAGIHSHAEPSQAPGSADSGTSDPENIKPDDDITQEGDSAAEAVEKPTNSEPHALGHPLANRRHRSEYSPLPMEVRQITIGVGEEYPRQPRHYRPPRRVNDSWSIRKNLSTGSVSEF